MSQMRQTPPLGIEQFFVDFIRTYARLLDPNLPLATRVVKNDVGDVRWPLGQTAAFAIISSLGLLGVVSALIYYVA